MEQENVPKRNGRPKGSKTRQDRRTPKPLVADVLVSSRVPAHVWQRMAGIAEAGGVSVSALVGKALAGKWPCRCEECKAARSEMRRQRRAKTRIYEAVRVSMRMDGNEVSSLPNVFPVFEASRSCTCGYGCPDGQGCCAP